jgi:integrase
MAGFLLSKVQGGPIKYLDIWGYRGYFFTINAPTANQIPPNGGDDMALTDVKVRNAKAEAKQVKLSDAGGMYLLVTPQGGKCWRLKYRFGGKEKVLALGTYPEVSLLEAREKREAARKQLAKGIDPGEARKAEKRAGQDKAANSFEAVAREWHSRQKSVWSEGHAERTLQRLEGDIFPCIGVRPISEITPPELLAVFRRIESRGAHETAHRARFVCGQVFRYAVATGRAERDPAADLKGALTPLKVRHHPAITDPKEVAPLLRAIDGYHGSFVVKCAMQLAALLFVRPGELRQAEWSEIDFENGQWNIPAERMKMKVAHIVPLSKQAICILKELQALTSNSRYLFPCHRSFTRPMSNNAVNAALRYLGFDSDTMTGHGFRAMARTILDEVLQVRPDFIEHQLAHSVKDPNGRAYNRTAHLAERRNMMQTWADYLDGLKSGAKVIPLKRHTAE